MPNSLLKNALREEGCTWLIKCPGQENLSDVRHFNRFIIYSHTTWDLLNEDRNRNASVGMATDVECVWDKFWVFNQPLQKATK